MFTVNPLGTRLDARFGTRGFNISWDAEWEAATQVLDDRWIVEISIPLGVMYLNRQDDQTWGINLFRDNQEKNEFSRWAYNPEILNRTERFGEMRGLDLSNVNVVTNPQIETYGSVTVTDAEGCLLYTSPSPRDQRGSRMPSSA